MADSAALPLVVFMSEEEEKNNNKQARAASPLPTVTHVILWTRSNAVNFAISFAIAFVYPSVSCLLVQLQVEPSWLQWLTVEMTDAEDAAATDALMVGILWCVVSQAAAGALALMLPSHRRRLRLVLAYAALVATTASHSMFAALGHRIVAAAEPGGLLCFNTAAIFIFMLNDLLCFLGLILRGGEE